MEYRLNRYISSSGYCSRREADDYIEKGMVKVGGRKAQIGDRVLPGQEVMINGHIIVNDIEPVYIAFNKPVGVVCTTDTSERDNIVDFISHEHRVFPIGRLDKDSQGLILLTNDGDIVNKILRAGNNNPKEYIVTVDREITDEFMHDMAHGVPILDRVTRRCEMEKINPFTFKIGLTQGLNRQIRRMCEYFHYNVVKLERIQVMNISLEGLGMGNWRALTEGELTILFDLLEDAENAEAKPKRKSPSTLKHEAERKAKREKGFPTKKTKEIAPKIEKPKTEKKAKTGDEEYEKPKGTRFQRKDPSGERVGKHRPDKLARRTRTRELNYKRKGQKKK